MQTNQTPQQVNYAAPQGQMQTNFVVPDTGGDTKKKLDSVEMMSVGPHLGIIYSIVDLGTQTTQFKNQEPEQKRYLRVGIEFPQKKQLFYEGDTEFKSTIATDEFSMFITAENSNLRAFIHSVLGRSITNEEARSFNIFSLLGMKVGVNIIHKVSANTGNPYMKIDNYFTPNENFQEPQGFVPSLEREAFFIDCDQRGNVIGENFKTVNFANLNNFVRGKVLASKEAMEYASRGGVFAKNPDQQQQQQSGPSFANPQQGGIQNPQATSPTQNGVANPPQQQQYAQPQQVAAPPVQQQPQQQPQQQVAPPPAQPAPPSNLMPSGYQMANPNGAPIDSYLNSGWSVDQLISHGVLVPVAVQVQAPAQGQVPENDRPF